jgi:hypothetical protein
VSVCRGDSTEMVDLRGAGTARRVRQAGDGVEGRWLEGRGLRGG